MTVLVRLRRGLFEAIHQDLRVGHPFAYERVGFVYGPFVRLSAELTLVLPAHYVPVPDDEYIRDPSVGARINRDALRGALQRVLTTGDCCLHVHAHAGSGTPRFSSVDDDMLIRFSPALQAVGTGARHGGLVLSNDGAAATFWSPLEHRLEGGRVTIVGAPIWLGTESKGNTSWW